MRGYVKEFNSSILHIKNVFKEDRLFNLMFGLQGWVQTKLQKARGVRPSCCNDCSKLFGGLQDSRAISINKTTSQREQRNLKQGGIF